MRSKLVLGARCRGVEPFARDSEQFVLRLLICQHENAAIFSTHGIMTTFSVRKPGAQPSGTDRDEFGPTESSHRVEDVAGNHGPDSFFHRRRPISFTLMVV